MMEFHAFKSRDAASRASAGQIAFRLNARLASDSAAAIVVSGGTSPVDCFAHLAQTALDWGRVVIHLSDERWIDPGDDASNEKLVRTHLAVNQAAGASVAPIYAPGVDVESHCDALDAQLRQRNAPFAASLLGMGTDGHFASLFPDALNLEEGLDPGSSRQCIAVTTAASPLQRVSLTLNALNNSDEIILLFFGNEKRRVFDAAVEGAGDYPVTRLLKTPRTRLSVFWAP